MQPFKMFKEGQSEPAYGPDYPARVKVILQPYEKGDSRFIRRDGSQMGYSLFQLRTVWGGKNEGQIVDPLKGLTHNISIEPWANRDPQTTYLFFTFRLVEDNTAADNTGVDDGTEPNFN